MNFRGDHSQIYSQKDIVPSDISMMAKVTKKGPAAPVILFPHRSIVLKQLNTHFAQIMAASIALVSSQNALKAVAVRIVIDAY